MEKHSFTVSDAVVEELNQAGVEVIFGIVSIHNMPIYDAVIRDGKIRLATARSEAAAVNMADAYARATGKLGVVLTSTGAGAGNGAGSLTEAWNSGTPLLHITGEVDSNYIGMEERYIHECKDQLKMMDGASKSAYLLKRPERIISFMKKAIADAQTVPKGPVTVQIPTNFQAKIVPESQLHYYNQLTETSTKVNLPKNVMEQIKAARRPVLWVGDGIVHANASEELTALAEKLGAAVITSESGKGAMDESHALCIGNFAWFEEVEDFLVKADLLISIGVRFRGTETNSWTTKLPASHIHIDLNPEALNRGFTTPTFIVGDAKEVLVDLLEQLGDGEFTADSAYVEEVHALRKQVREVLIESIKPYDQFAQKMNEHLPENSILITDVTMPGYTWANKLVDVHAARNYLYMTGGGIGQGLPMAIGAKVAQPNKAVVLVAGDGGFMVNSNEMITAVQENAPIITLLFDDGGYGILKYYQEAAYQRQEGVDLINPDFVMLGKASGYHAEKVTSVEAFGESLAAALQRDKSSLIVVDVKAVGLLEYEDSPEYIKSFRPHQ